MVFPHDRLNVERWLIFFESTVKALDTLISLHDKPLEPLAQPGCT